MSNDFHEGARALLGLKKTDDGKSDKSRTVEDPNDNSDNVEAAVLKYVGGTLTDNDSGKRSKRRKSYTQEEEENEFAHWNDFLETDRLQQEEPTANLNLVPGVKPAKKGKSNKRRKQAQQLDELRVTASNVLDVDPDLAQLAESNDHEQLVRAALLDAKQLAQDDIQSYIDQTHDTTKYDQLDANIIQAAAIAAQQQQDEIDSSLSNVDKTGARSNELNSKAVSVSDSPYKNHNKLDVERLLQQPAQSLLSMVNHNHNQSTALDIQPQRPNLPQKNKNKLPALLNHQISQDALNLAEAAAKRASDTIQNKVPGKMFSVEETDAINKFMEEFQKINGMTRRQVCERVWANERKKDDFWELLNRVLPYRSRASIYKHVRRAFHIFEVRGTWTPEEDERLGKLAIEQSGQWKLIAIELGRMPEDCRDRWRNYVKCGNNRASNKWTTAEETRLQEVINEMASVMNSDVKDLSINWTVVSERMGGTRSRIQCRYKWNKLIKRETMDRIRQIDVQDRFWLLSKIQEMGYIPTTAAEWDNLASSHVKHFAKGDDFSACYDKMQSRVRDWKKKTFQEIISILLSEIIMEAAKKGVQLELPVVIQQFESTQQAALSSQSPHQQQALHPLRRNLALPIPNPIPNHPLHPQNHSQSSIQSSNNPEENKLPALDQDLIKQRQQSMDNYTRMAQARKETSAWNGNGNGNGDGSRR